MSDNESVDIPDEAVEAAARVLGYDPDWDSETDREENRWFLSRARQMLEAAAPHMAAQAHDDVLDEKAREAKEEWADDRDTEAAK